MKIWPSCGSERPPNKWDFWRYFGDENSLQVNEIVTFFVARPTSKSWRFFGDKKINKWPNQPPNPKNFDVFSWSEQHPPKCPPNRWKLDFLSAHSSCKFPAKWSKKCPSKFRGKQVNRVPNESRRNGALNVKVEPKKSLNFVKKKQWFERLDGLVSAKILWHNQYCSEFTLIWWIDKLKVSN